MAKRRSSLTGGVIREVIATISSNNLIGERLKNGDIRRNLVEPKWVVPLGYQMQIIRIRSCVVELLQPDVRRDDMVLLQLHGGGYVAGMRNAYRDFAIQYSELGGGIDVLTVDYRVAPEYPFPAALEDAVEAWNWLINKGWLPNEIVVAGDSAGGGLAMALCHYLKNQNRKLPGGLIAMSPWTDMTASGNSYVKNYHNDPLFGNSSNSMIYNREYAQNNDLTNPYLSPLFGNFRGFPPMLIQVGSYEMLLSDSVSVAHKARENGVRVRLSIYTGMFHVFQMAMKLLPESRRAWAEVGRFLNVIHRYISREQSDPDETDEWNHNVTE